MSYCQKQHRDNEPAGQVDILTRVEEVHVMIRQGDNRHHCQNNTDMNQLVR